MKKINEKTAWRIFYILLLVISLLLLIFKYTVSFERLISSFADIVYSTGEYFNFLFDLGFDIPDRVNQVPDVDIRRFIPFDLDELCRKLTEMWPRLFTKENLFGYLIAFVDLLYLLRYNVLLCSVCFLGR